MMGECLVASLQGLYSLSGKMSYRKVLEAVG